MGITLPSVFLVSPKETTVTVDPTGPILEGSSVSLLCRSRSNPPVTNYTWFRDDEVDREDGPVLSIDDINPSHSGGYRCTVKNPLGEEASAKIKLDVQCESAASQRWLKTERSVVDSGESSWVNPDMRISQDD